MKPTGKSLVRGTVAVIGLALGLSLTPILHADENDGGGQSGRAARLSSVDGQVQISQGDQMLADHAVANTPLFEGTQLTTGSDGRAEIQFDDGSVARIPPESSVTLSMLRVNSDTEIVLSNGMGFFELQGGSDAAPIRVRFGSNEITANGFTVIRVKLDEGPASIAVFSGNARLDSSGGGGVDLHGGESISLNGSTPADSTVAESIEPDSWDAWNADRDQALTSAETATTDADQNLPQSNNPAWGDLKTNGTWYNTPDQGYIWSPYEASNPGWDPYGTGNWMWTPNFGYVWVSGEPWGYMPYQCGAWNYYDAFGWGWAPGGCQTWWGGGGIGGGGGWIFTVGNTPRWYKLPQRPGLPRPRSPHPLEGPHADGPRPFIPVNRRLPLASGAPLPPRRIGTPVMIGGSVTTPLRPVSSRPVYGHPNSTGTRTMTGSPVQNENRPQYGMRPNNGNQPYNGNRPENGNRPQNGVQPENGNRPVFQRPNELAPGRGNWPTARPTQPSESPRPAPAPRAPQPSEGPRPSFGGGGGGRSTPPPAAPSRPSSPPPAASHPSPPPASGHPK